MILSRTLPRHPFDDLDGRALKAAAWASSAASLLLGALLLWLGRPLTTAAAPHGLASFELAWRPADLEAVLASWGAAGRSRAVLMTWVDYPFLAAYGVSLAALAKAVPGSARLPALAAAAGWAAVAASALDAVENAAALLLLSGAPPSPLCLVQAACAAPKFLLAAAALAWVAAGAFIRAPRD